MKVIWRLLRYVSFYKGKAVLCVFLTVVVAVLACARIPILMPLFNALFDSDEAILAWTDKLPQFLDSYRAPLREFIENRVLPNRFETLSVVIGMLLILSFSKGLAHFFQRYTAGKIQTGVTRRVAADLYQHVVGLSVSFYSRAGTPSIISRFTNDVEAVGRGLNTLLVRALLQPLLLVVFLATAALINWRLLLMNMALFPVLAVAIYMFGRKAKRAASKGLHSRDRLLNILQETLEGITIVKAFNMQPREQERFAAENRRVLRQDLRVVKVEAATSPFVEFVTIVGLGVSVVVAGWWVTRGQMTAGSFVTFYGALVSVFDPIRKLSRVNNHLQMLRAAAGRVFAYFDETTDIVEKPGARALAVFSNEIRFENVYFTYDDVDTVLRKVDLVARKGEIVAFVGPSGAGKTTIARLIPRFYDPTAGAVTIDGVDLREVTLASLRGQIGLVTQEVILFNDTVAANISYGRPDASKEQVEAAAGVANAHEFILELSQGYDTVVGEKGLTLSGGQRQRIALARAILKDPPILILDEATSSLDSQSEFLIQQALDQFMQNRTNIVIAHRLSTVERASRIYVVEGGEVIASGTNRELLSESPLYKKLYQMQFHTAAV